MGLKSSIRTFLLKKSKYTNKKPFIGFKRAETIGICFQTVIDKRAIEEYQKKLLKDGKLVKLLEYVPKRKKEIENEGLRFDSLWFCKSDVNWMGNPKNEDVQRFLSNHFDVYIDLVNEEEHPVDFITTQAKSSFKIGAGLKSIINFDLSIKLKEKSDLEQTFKEIDYYLNFINQTQK